MGSTIKVLVEKAPIVERCYFNDLHLDSLVLEACFRQNVLFLQPWCDLHIFQSKREPLHVSSGNEASAGQGESVF